MASVNGYQVLFYGSPDGYKDSRAQIVLYQDQDVVGYVRFHDPTMSFVEDHETGGVIYMYLPTDRLADVIDVLRNEQPINFYFAVGRAFLGTYVEPVGEGE